MKRLMLLMQVILQECGIRCGISTDRDWKTITKRVENEGLEFLTLTLPAFCSEFELALKEGQSYPSNWSFGCQGGTPKFLGGFLDLIFDRDTGRLVEDLVLQRCIQKYYPEYSASSAFISIERALTEFPSAFEEYAEWYSENTDRILEAVAGVRQITRLFSKIEIEAASSRIDQTFEQFLDCEKELAASEGRRVIDIFSRLPIPQGMKAPMTIGDVGRLLYGELYYDLCKELMEGFPVPKHGPGSTADQLLGNKKWEQTEWPERLDQYFPAGEYLLPSWRYV